MGESLSSMGPGAWGGSGSRDPPRKSETEKGMEDVREGIAFGNGIWMHPATSESLHRLLYASARRLAELSIHSWELIQNSNSHSGM